MLVNIALALVLAAGPKGRAKESPPPPPPAPTAQTRVLAITDENANDVFPVAVAHGKSTWLLLPAAVKPPLSAKAELGPELNGKLLILTPPAPLAPDERFPLVVNLDDGGPPVVFEVRAGGAQYDSRVTVERQLQRRLSSDSAQAVGERLELCRQELDELRAGGGAKNVLAAAVAAVPAGRTATLVRHDLNETTKQNFVWVKARHSYRLFDFTFAVLEVSNRQDGTVWVMRGATVRQRDGGDTIPVVVQNDQPKGIRAGETARIVVGFATPADNTRRVDLTLTDDAGSRNVVLENLAL